MKPLKHNLKLNANLSLEDQLDRLDELEAFSF